MSAGKPFSTPARSRGLLRTTKCTRDGAFNLQIMSTLNACLTMQYSTAGAGVVGLTETNRGFVLRQYVQDLHHKG
jgi:hypothetical protein